MGHLGLGLVQSLGGDLGRVGRGQVVFRGPEEFSPETMGSAGPMGPGILGEFLGLPMREID